uniref:Vinculin n=1 Tax=Paramoeba aestuarina TaxID=180227 RepID=A0A7S4NUC0_9EUKA
MSRDMPLIKKQIRDGQDITDSLNRLLNGLDQLGQMCAPYASEEQTAADLMKDDLEKLEKAVDKGDGEAAKRSVARVVENQKKLEAAPFGDDNTGQHQKENVAGLSKDVPADIKALRECLADAKNPEKKDDFKKANEVVKADARQVGAYAAPSGAADLDELLDELQCGVREAVEASKDNDPKKLQEQCAVINGARAKMKPVVARSAQANTDPVRRRNEIGKWKDLNDCLDDLLNAVKGGDDIEVERKKEKVLDALEDYRDAAGVDPLAAAEDVRRSAADFVAAAVKDDREKIPEKAKDTQQAVAALHAPAQKAALRTGDPEINERVLGDLDRLDQLMQELVELGAQEVDAHNNRDAPAALRTAKEMNKKYDDIDNTVDDLTSALKPGVGKKHPNGPQSVEHDIPPHLRQLYAAAKELERKLPAVIATAEDAQRNPQQQEKDAFAKALEDLEMPLRGIKAADSDEDKAVALSHVLQDHIEDMADAAKKGEPDGVVCGARLGSDTKAKLGPLLEDIASREEDPKKAAKIRDLAQQLENEFPKTIVAARKALQNPNDKQAQEELERAQDKVDDILEGLRFVVAKAPAEDAIGTRDDLKKSMQAILGYVKAGQKRNAVQEARKAAATDLDPLKKYVEGLENEDDLLSALDRLLELLKDMEQQTPKAADAPPGSQPRKELEDMVDQASKLLDKIVDESGGEALAAIQGEKRDLRDLHDDIAKEDPNALKADIKEVVASHRDVLDKLKNEQPKLMHASPNRAKELGDAIEEMEALMPQVIQKTKGAIVNPDNHAAQRELDEAISTLEVPLAKSANAVAPSALRDLKAKAKEVDRQGRAVAAGTMAGDVAKAQKNSDQLNDLKPLKDAVDERLRQMEKNNPVLAKQLEDKMAEVEEAAKDVQRSAKDPSKVGEASDKLSHKLRELEEAAEASDIPADVALAAAQKDDLLRALKGPLSSANKLDMNDLLKMAMDLSDSMGGMIGKVEDDVRRQGGGAGVLAALKMLRDLEKKASEPIKAPKLEEKAPEPKKAKAQRPLPAAPAADADFSDRVKHMAEVIDVTSDAAQDEKLSSTAQGLSATLIRLAEAAKSGDRMGILAQTKDAVADINRLVLVFKEIAEEITDRKMKDRMVWLSSMLKDVATNLKILCSVKAASGGPDNDDQIVSVITSVKNIFTEGLDLANIAEKTNKRKKRA